MGRIVILGGGLAGLSVAFHLKKGYLLFEKEDRAGGLCRSHQVKGFTFDYTGHLLHFRSSYVKDLAFRLLGENIKSHRRRAWIFSHNVFTRYPFQANTFGLPPEVIKECLLGFLESRRSRSSEASVKNFHQWILKQFGSGIARHFMLPYNRKLWTIPLEEISLDWLNPFVPRPTVAEVIKGALIDQQSNLGYNAQFYYPKYGGIESLVQAFLANLSPIYTGYDANKIDLNKKEVYFGNGEKAGYEILVSTLPLPELIKICQPVPVEVKEAASKLKFCSVYNLNLGIRGRRHRNKHWVYFPEEDFSVYRVGLNTSFCPQLAPSGQSSIYTEVSYSASKPLDREGIDEKIKADLLRVGVIDHPSDITVKLPLDIKYAYVIYDHQRQKRVDITQSFLQANQIYSLGRFGSWSYLTMEDVILEGRKVAHLIGKQ